MTDTSNLPKPAEALHVEVISIARARAYWLAVDEMGAIGSHNVSLELVGQPGDNLRINTSRNETLGRMGFMRSIGDLAPYDAEGPSIKPVIVPTGKVAMSVAKVPPYDGSLRSFYARTNAIHDARKRELKAIEGIADLLARNRIASVSYQPDEGNQSG